MTTCGPIRSLHSNKTLTRTVSKTPSSCSSKAVCSEILLYYFVPLPIAHSCTCPTIDDKYDFVQMITHLKFKKFLVLLQSSLICRSQLFSGMDDFKHMAVNCIIVLASPWWHFWLCWGWNEPDHKQPNYHTVAQSPDPHSLHSLWVLYTTQDHLTWDAVPTVTRSFYTSIFIQDNISQAWPQANLM